MQLFTKQIGEVKSPCVFTYSPCNYDLELSYWHPNHDQSAVPILPFFRMPHVIWSVCSHPTWG